MRHGINGHFPEEESKTFLARWLQLVDDLTVLAFRIILGSDSEEDDLEDVEEENPED